MSVDAIHILHGEFLRDTTKAAYYLVQIPKFKPQKVWIPKSQIIKTEPDPEHLGSIHDMQIITISEWFAKKSGLLPS